MNVRATAVTAAFAVTLLIAMRPERSTAVVGGSLVAATPGEITLNVTVGTTTVETWTGDLTFEVDLGVFSFVVEELPNANGVYTVSFPLQPGELDEFDSVYVSELIVYPTHNRTGSGIKGAYFTSPAAGMAGFVQRFQLDSNLSATIDVTMSEAPLFGSVQFSESPPADAYIEAVELNSDGSVPLDSGRVFIEEWGSSGLSSPISIYSWKVTGTVWIAVSNSHHYFLGGRHLRRQASIVLDIQALTETTFSFDSSVYSDPWKVVAFRSSEYIPTTPSQFRTIDSRKERQGEAVWHHAVVDMSVDSLFTSDIDVTFELWGGNRRGSSSPEYFLLDSRARPSGAGLKNVVFN